MSRRTAWNADRASLRIGELRQLPGAVLPILHALQEEFGYIDQAAVPLIADALNLSRAEVHGVVSFYHDFRHAPPGRHVLKLCRAEACQSMGADALAAEAREQLRVGWGETTADGRVTLEPVFCLGPVRLLRRRRCSTARSSAGSTAHGSAHCSTRCGGHDAPAHLCAARRRRAGAWRGRGRARDRRRRTPPRHRGRDRAHRLARPVIGSSR